MDMAEAQLFVRKKYVAKQNETANNTAALGAATTIVGIADALEGKDNKRVMALAQSIASNTMKYSKRLIKAGQLDEASVAVAKESIETALKDIVVQASQKILGLVVQGVGRVVSTIFTEFLLPVLTVGARVIWGISTLLIRAAVGLIAANPLLTIIASAGLAGYLLYEQYKRPSEQESLPTLFKRDDRVQNVRGSTGDALEDYLVAAASVESNNNPNAKNENSSAAGLYQFIDSTWQDTVKAMGKNYSLNDRYDPSKSLEVARYFTQKQQGELEKGLGHKVGAGDLYLAHFLGSGGALKFIKAYEANPNASAASLFPKEAAANHNVFYYKDGRPRSMQETYNELTHRLVSRLPTKQGNTTAELILPTSGKLTSKFGLRQDPKSGQQGAFHAGIDIAAPEGTPIVASTDGIVARSEMTKDYGNVVEIKNGNLLTRYGHASRLLVAKNEQVKQGQTIGLVGSTGKSTGNHLHFEVLVDNKPVNPLASLPSNSMMASSALSPPVSTPSDIVKLDNKFVRIYNNG